MIINPNLKKENLCFYNNLMLIVTVFCVIFFWSYFNIESQVVSSNKYSSLAEGSTYGPIVVKKGQPKICKIESNMFGNNINIYFSGEVLDEDKDTLYEFGKELWHEDGYDSEGYWSESDRKMSASLTFSEPGKYYIKFNTDENLLKNITLTIKVKKGSGIPYLMMGTCLFIIVLVFFTLLNRVWLSEKFDNLNDLLEEMSDD